MRSNQSAVLLADYSVRFSSGHTQLALNCRCIELHGPAPVPRSETGAGCASIPYGEEKLLYIATPGSDEKQSGAKPSQVLQLDR